MTNVNLYRKEVSAMPVGAHWVGHTDEYEAGYVYYRLTFSRPESVWLSLCVSDEHPEIGKVYCRVRK